MIAAFVLMLGGYHQYRQQRMTEEIAGKIVRFHIRANSDDVKDQELKLKVRDAVGAYMQPKLSNVSDIAGSRRVIRENLGHIIEKAEQVIEAEGYHYDVSAALTTTDFPEKTYGEYTFPAGRYEALEVVIGEGEGHNWWCVMYPNLCFFNSVYAVVDEEAEKSLEHVLTQEEYESLMENKDYEVKSAFWEFLKDTFGI